MIESWEKVVDEASRNRAKLDRNCSIRLWQSLQICRKHARPSQHYTEIYFGPSPFRKYSC